MKRDITFEELRQVQLGLMDKIDAFCRKRGIRYSLGGGTLLGAVRHKGFIPWDDDVDMMMPRPDYETFLREFTDEHIKIQTPDMDSDAVIPFAKVYDDRTVLEEFYAKNGVFIDLFPIDGLPDEAHLPAYLAVQQKYFDCLYRIKEYRDGLFYQYEPTHPRWFVWLKYWFKHLSYPTKQTCLEELKKLYTTYDFDTSAYAGAICGAYAAKEHMEQQTFIEYIDLTFEGRMYMCIAAYDSYLTKHYGDYMQLPPVEKQKASHSFVAYWKD